MKRRTTGRRGVQLHLALLALALPALGVEVTVQNDSFQSGQPAYIVGDFVPGEHAGARLTSPCDGAIVAVQIAWLEGTPGHGPSLEEAIHIYDGSTFPTPGLELERLEAPALTPGFLNEFRWVDENQTIPLHVPVVAGQDFYVTLEFANPTNVGAGGASVIRDVDGCQGGRNVLFAKPGGWMDFCLFLQGDLVIRAVIDCPEPTGACCLVGGGCLVLTEADCGVIPNSYWAGAGTDCSDKNSNGVPDACEVSPGDLNCDSAVDFDDIDPFVLALAGQTGYRAQYPNCNWLNADCNEDGSVNFDDIDPFVALLAP